MLIFQGLGFQMSCRRHTPVTCVTGLTIISALRHTGPAQNTRGCCMINTHIDKKNFEQSFFITSIFVVISCWNFTRSKVVSKFKTVWQLRNKSRKMRYSGIWVHDGVFRDILYAIHCNFPWIVSRSAPFVWNNIFFWYIYECVQLRNKIGEKFLHNSATNVVLDTSYRYFVQNGFESSKHNI